MLRNVLFIAIMSVGHASNVKHTNGIAQYTHTTNSRIITIECVGSYNIHTTYIYTHMHILHNSYTTHIHTHITYTHNIHIQHTHTNDTHTHTHKHLPLQVEFPEARILEETLNILLYEKPDGWCCCFYKYICIYKYILN